MKRIVVLALMPLMFACKKDAEPSPVPAEPPTDKVEIRLKELNWHLLPSPLYKFTYNNQGYISMVQYADGARTYDVAYQNKLISAMNATYANNDQLQYLYDGDKVAAIKYNNASGETFRRCFLDYNAKGQLTHIEWELKSGTGFVAERTFSFTYFNNGNLKSKLDEKYEIPGRQTPALYLDEYDDYDDKKNSDGFMLLHDEQSHLFVLPRVVMQKNNPRKETRSGTGVNYKIAYTYQYNPNGTVSRKTGAAQFTSGPDVGKNFQITLDLIYE